MKFRSSDIQNLLMTRLGVEPAGGPRRPSLSRCATVARRVTRGYRNYDRLSIARRQVSEPRGGGPDGLVLYPAAKLTSGRRAPGFRELAVERLGTCRGARVPRAVL